MNIGKCWRGEDDGFGVARFGRKARAWLRRRILAELFTPDDEQPDYPFRDPDGTHWSRDSLDLVLDWYLSDPFRFVAWVDADEWRGSDYANGAWTFDAKAVKDSFLEASDSAERELDAGSFETLDDWLRADARGDLYYRGDPGGMARVAPEVRRRVREAAIVARDRRAAEIARRSGVCTACRRPFLRDRRNARRCIACRTAARSTGSKHAQ